MVHAPHIEGETLTKIKHSDVTKLMMAMLNEEKYTSIRPLIMTALARWRHIQTNNRRSCPFSQSLKRN